jgi:CDP-glucose 4,6-dehydratase
MESMVTMPFGDIYRGKRVLVTGHTGFKGSWLCEWLVGLGAEVSGYALDPLPEAILFDQLALSRRMVSDVRGDIRDRDRLIALIAAARPEFVFHLAAQPLVRLSYREPADTFDVNVMGTVNVMEGLRRSDHTCVAVMVTTDKCYENEECLHAYRESDPMGGQDPYSASKGAAEIAISAYRRSFFSAPESPVRLASARAGNVIGGGDWAVDRIVPDCIRALQAGQPVPVRNKTSTRPWQHVLEPLSGYLLLGASIHQAALHSPLSTLNSLCSAFNFGPALTSNRTVQELVEEILKHWPGTWSDQSDPHAVHEAGRLNLATDKAFHLLGWQPVWNFEQTIADTASWYRDADEGAMPAELTRRHLATYVSSAASAGAVWVN